MKFRISAVVEGKTIKLNKVIVIAALALTAGISLAACSSVVIPAAAPAATPKAAAPASATPAAVTPPKTVYVPVVPAAPVSAMTSCIGGEAPYYQVWAGPNTSCPFALNVAADYTGPGVDYAYSPVTGLYYPMNCAIEGADTVVCTGGDNAYVQF